MNDDLIIEGQHGAGKTTMAVRAAEALGGVYVKPFTGTLGAHMSWLSEHGRNRELNAIGLSAVERMIDLNPRGPRVFDRHWASMFSILPEEYWHDWYPVPPITVVCHAEPMTAYRRLRERGDDPLDLTVHHRFQTIFRDLAGRFDTLLLDTTHRTAESCLAAALGYYMARTGRTYSAG